LVVRDHRERERGREEEGERKKAVEFAASGIVYRDAMSSSKGAHFHCTFDRLRTRLPHAERLEAIVAFWPP